MWINPQKNKSALFSCARAENKKVSESMFCLWPLADVFNSYFSKKKKRIAGRKITTGETGCLQSVSLRSHAFSMLKTEFKHCKNDPKRSYLIIKSKGDIFKISLLRAI